MTDEGNEFVVFKNKDLSGLFRDIYNNQRATQSQIGILIDSLRPLIKTAGDAAVIVPLIKDYLEVSVKNDSHIVRLASIVQRLYAAEKLSEGGSAGGILTEAEKKYLLEQAELEINQIQGGQKEMAKQIADSESKPKQIEAALTGGEEADQEEKEEVEEH